MTFDPMKQTFKKRPRKVEEDAKKKQKKSVTSTTTKTTSAATATTADVLSSLSSTTCGVCTSVSSRYQKVGSRVGQGTYGVVYQAQDKQTHRIVALKRCIPHHRATDGFPTTTLREIHALRVCARHPNVVDLLEIAVSTSSNHSEKDSNGDNKGGVFLVFEYCPHDVANILDRHYSDSKAKNHPSPQLSCSPFSEAQVKTLLQQLLSALEWCHRHFLIHRDIKPSNLLYTSEGVLKLCDFGLSRQCSGRDDGNHMTQNVVSLWYRAPELFWKMKSNSSDCPRRRENYFNYSFPIDLFAVGCIFGELLLGYPLLDGKTELEQVQKMTDCLGQPPSRLYLHNDLQPRSKYQVRKNNNSVVLWDRFDYLSTEGLTLMTRLMEYGPKERWTASQALKSDYFTTNPLPATEMPRF